MGFTYCISVNLGPFRVNLSKFSLGYSVGGRGFCVGTTAREKKYCLTRSRRALPIGCLAAGYQVWPPSRPAAQPPSRPVPASASLGRELAVANPVLVVLSS